jgi:hypothetical protein
MTSRARTTQTAKATPAKKTAAKKPATKRTPRARTPGKTATAAPALSLVKDSTDTTTPNPTTLVDLRHALPVRRRFVGPLGATEQAAARAALAAAAARLPIPVRTWNGSTAQLADGTLLIHNPGPDRLFTAHIACPHGAIHGTPIRTLHDLHAARTNTHACQHPHGGVNADQAITTGVNTSPPKALTPVLVVHEGLRRTADTQPLSQTEIADGLTNRTADNEQAKEHPAP